MRNDWPPLQRPEKCLETLSTEKTRHSRAEIRHDPGARNRGLSHQSGRPQSGLPQRFRIRTLRERRPIRQEKHPHRALPSGEDNRGATSRILERIANRHHNLKTFSPTDRGYIKADKLLTEPFGGCIERAEAAALAERARADLSVGGDRHEKLHRPFSADPPRLLGIPLVTVQGVKDGPQRLALVVRPFLRSPDRGRRRGGSALKGRCSFS